MASSKVFDRALNSTLLQYHYLFWKPLVALVKIIAKHYLWKKYFQNIDTSDAQIIKLE